MRKFYKLLLLAILMAILSPTTFAQEKSETFYKENASGWVNEMLNPAGNVYEAKKAFDIYWNNKDLTVPKATKGKGYKPFLRWYEFMAPRVFPTGNMPDRSIAQKEFEKSTNNSEVKASASWTFMGPTAPSGYVQNGSYQSPGGSGRVNAITFDPNNSSIVWAGTPSGGLWKSTNGGSSWTLISDQFDVMGISAIAIDYTNTNIMYIGTGDRDAGDTYSIGILKSTDGGNSWNPTSVTFDKSQTARCTDILIHPTSPQTLLASFNGVVYRTTDGFATKTTVASLSIFDMEFKPGDPNTVYAAGSAFYKSTNGGTSFTQVTSGLPTSDVQRMEIAVTAASPTTVMILAGKASDQGLLGVYKSTTSGTSFTTTYSGTSGNLLGWEPVPSQGIGDGGQAFYDLTIAINPTNANEVFVGGVNLYKSTNGGTSWACSAYWLAGSSYQYGHADYHAIEYLNGTTVYVGNDGGVFKTTNNGSVWTDVSNNLGIAQVARFGISASNPNIIMTGMQDNGTNKYNGTDWSIVYGGDGCESAVDPTNTNTVYASYVYGDIKRSTNGGSSWTSIRPTTAQGAWITPYVIDPNSNVTLYAGYAHIYKTTNQGTNWSQIGTTPGSGTISQIAVAPSNSSYIYFIKEYRTSSGTTYTVGKTTNGGSSWTSMSGLPLTTAAPTYIAVSINDPNTLWVTFSGYSAGQKVYKTTNGGTSWTNVSGNLPNLPVNTVVYQKNSDDLVYVGSDIGVYYKDNNMSDWAVYSDGLPHTVVNELEIYYDNANAANSKLRAATYGRSVWETPLATGADVCNTPSGLSVTNTTNTSATLNWAAVTGAVSYDVQYKAVSASSWNTYNTSSTSRAITGLSTTNTQYEFHVRTNCASGTSSYSASYNFGYTPVTYCASKGNSVSDEWLQRVVIGTIDNNSGANGGYGDFTAITTDLALGSSVSFTLYPAWSGTVYAEGFAIWIDYNKNGSFDDSGELVYSKAASTATSVTGTFTVPSTVSQGATRMRISMKYNGIPTSCEAFPYGEVEDYTVVLVADNNDTTSPTAPANLAASNITQNGVSLNWTASSDNVGVTGYQIFRNGTLITSVTGTSYTVSGLTAATTYSFYVKAYDAKNNVSAASNTVSVSTLNAPDTQVPTAPANLASSSVTQTSCNLIWSASTDNFGVTGYQVFRNGTMITTVTGTSYSVTGLTAATAYSFYVKAFDAAGNISASSNTVNVTTTSVSVYCVSKGTNVNDEWIQRVVLVGINNNSGANGGYADFTSLSASITQNASQTITVYPGWSGTVYAEGYAVWIDYNKDGDFEDSGELVFSKAASKTTPVTGTFTVPSTASVGTTRMRVSMAYNDIPTSCETFTYGEVEDYTVNILASVADTQAPSAPANLSASNITQSSLSLSWSASTDNIGVTKYNVYRNGAFLSSVTTTSASVTGLSSATTYSFYVKALDAAGNESNASNTINVTTSTITLTYCASKGNSVSDEWVQRVVFGSIDNNSGANGGYVDFTSKSTIVNVGSSYSISIYPAWSGTVYSEAYAVWIDYNRDGDFTDSGETVFSKATSTSTVATGSFTIPATATLGATRMRVSMKYNGIPTSCEAFAYGEVEDYTVVIEGTKSLESINLSDLLIYPNPAKDEIKVQLNGADDISNVQIFSITGSVVKESQISKYSNIINISDLPAGIYTLRVISGNKVIAGKFIKR